MARKTTTPPLLPGVYAIFDTINGKVYIGSAKRVKQRMRNHLLELRNGWHRTKGLQDVFREHGEQALEFIVVQETTTEVEARKLEREVIWLTREYSYNKLGRGTLGMKSLAVTL